MRAISYPHTKQTRRPRRQRNASIGGAIALGVVMLAFCGACLFTLPVAARLIPPRYVARFVPEPVQGLFQSAHIELPTPQAAPAPHAVVALLIPLPTVALTGQPKNQPTSEPTGTPQPTRPPARPTPTVTSVPFLNPTVAARSTPAALEFRYGASSRAFAMCSRRGTTAARPI